MLGSIRNRIIEWYPQVFARNKYLKLNQFFVMLGLRGLGILNFNKVKGGEEFLARYIEKNYTLKTVFDVGANEGDYAEMLSGTGANIFCFEPHPKTCEKLGKRFRDHHTIKVYNVGLSDRDETAKIYDRSDEDGSAHASVYEEVITSFHKKEAVVTDISLITLDSFVEKNSIQHIDLLKIDTEGNELKVLKGAVETLKNMRIDIIQFEFNEMNVISGSFLRDFVRILDGYNLYRLLPNEFLAINYHKVRPVLYEIFAYQNIVAFRKDIDKIKRN